MDAKRNLQRYLISDGGRIAQFTGIPDWREKWILASSARISFDQFLVDLFAEAMGALQYCYGGIETTNLIRSVPKNLPLYRLAFFSRHDLGQRFWRETQRYASNQLSLFD